MAMHSDPTANQAIGNVMRARKQVRSSTHLAPAQSPGPRRLTVEFPDIFAGMLPHEAKPLMIKAYQLAGDMALITRGHPEQAKFGASA